MKITIHKGGTAEYTTELPELHIPDLWHVVASCPEDRAKLIECWHIAHALKKEMVEREAILNAVARALERAEATLEDIRTHWAPIGQVNCAAMKQAIAGDHEAICGVLTNFKAHL